MREIFFIVGIIFFTVAGLAIIGYRYVSKQEKLQKKNKAIKDHLENQNEKTLPKGFDLHYKPEVEQ